VRTTSRFRVGYKGGQAERKLLDSLDIPSINLEMLHVPAYRRQLNVHHQYKSCGNHTFAPGGALHCASVEVEFYRDHLLARGTSSVTHARYTERNDNWAAAGSRSKRGDPCHGTASVDQSSTSSEKPLIMGEMECTPSPPTGETESPLNLVTAAKVENATVGDKVHETSSESDTDDNAYSSEDGECCDYHFEDGGEEEDCFNSGASDYEHCL
jgi:hypothetical protein